MEHIVKFMNKKSTIITIRAIGYIYIIAIVINTIFFYGQYMYKTFLGSGFCGVISIVMISYKVPHKEEKSPIQKFFDKIDKLFDKITPYK